MGRGAFAEAGLLKKEPATGKQFPGKSKAVEDEGESPSGAELVGEAA